MKSSALKPIEKLTKSGTASVLFVQAFQADPNATGLRNSRLENDFWDVADSCLRSYAAISLKQDAGAWTSAETDSGIADSEFRITDAVEYYQSDVVVFLGINFACKLVRSFKDTRSKHDIRGTFGMYKLPRLEHTERGGETIPCMVLGTPKKAVEDMMEFARLPEFFAKLNMARKRYHEKPKIVNLNTYKKASKYIDFLANEHTGLVGFDTEAYSLNRVNHQRLGSLQFAHDEYEANVLLWDSKHQEMSARDLERLRPKLVHLFGSTDTTLDAWVAHNGMFDNMLVEGTLGTPIVKDMLDTMYLGHLMDENRKYTARVRGGKKEGPMSLKVMVKEFIAFFWYSDEAMKARSDGTLMELPLDAFLSYAGYDPVVTLRLLLVLREWARLQGYDGKVMNLLRKLHGRAIRLYSTISRNGFRIDRTRLIDLLRSDSVISKRVAEIEEAYKTYPEIRAVNAEILQKQTGVSVATMLKPSWVFNMNKAAHRNELFFHSKNGYQYGPNEDEKFSADKKFQKLYAEKNPVIGMFSEAQGLVKLRDAYIKPLFETLFGNPNPHADTCDGRVHSWFHLTRTVTGRVACLAKGTYVEMPRDVKKHPKGIKIENVKIGDLVYCYDKNRKPCLRKVTSAGKTGHRDVVRVHWQGSGHKHTGYVDLTPEHLVRLVSGKYVRADELNPKDRVMALSRDDQKSQRLYFTGSEGAVIEHRFVWDQTHPADKLSAGMHIHHVDMNHDNNVPSNLIKVTNSEHGRLHGLLGQSQETRDKKAAASRRMWAEGRGPQVRSGEDNSRFIPISRYACLRMLARCGGSVTEVRNRRIFDFNTFKSKLHLHGIDPGLVAARYGRHGLYISRALLLSLEESPITDIALALSVSVSKVRDLYKLYRIESVHASTKSRKSVVNKYRRPVYETPNNHEVLKVVKLRKKVDVYDITVEGAHNFIANEICVHNCSEPNSQQVPRSDSPVKKAIKSLFCPDDGKVLVQADLSAAEVRIWGGLSNDKRICELSVEAFDLRRRVRENPDDLALREEAELKADFHKQTYGLCFNKSPKDVTKSERQDAKKLSFGLIYGMGDNSIAREIGKELSVALDIKKRFFGVYREGTQWLTDMQRFGVENGYVETPLGRRRRFPEVLTGDRAFIAQAKRYAVNAPVQATASDYAMLSTIMLNDEIRKRKWEKDVKIVNCVHDSVVLEITATEEWLRDVAVLVRRIFTIDVVKQLKKDFGFKLNAPVDIDIEVSQWNMKKCKCCGNTQYHTDGKTCVKKLPVLKKNGKPKLDAEDKPVMKTCGSREFELIPLNAGWGYLTALAENERSFGLAAKGFKRVDNPNKAVQQTSNITSIADIAASTAAKKKLTASEARSRTLAFMQS